MLSYQHAYHAGAIADCLKHTLWAHLLAQLTQKSNPLHVYETHAGRGFYNTASPEMQKLKEYQTGLAKLPWQQESANPYLRIIKNLNPSGALAIIPGSPGIALHLLREADHLHLAEAHPGEMEHLKGNVLRSNLHLHLADGHALVPKHVRAGRRTAVLIDPSYEVKTEYAQTIATAQAILAANPQAVVMVWYPLLNGNAYRELVKGLTQLQVSATWQTEFTWAEAGAVRGAHGTGNIILNLPYQLERTLTPALKTCTAALMQKHGRLTARYLVARR